MKQHFISFGPAIPIVPLSHFSKVATPREMEESMWRIIGPSIEKNAKHLNWEMWRLITHAYMEGLIHGQELGRSERSDSEASQEGT